MLNAMEASVIMLYIRTVALGSYGLSIPSTCGTTNGNYYTILMLQSEILQYNTPNTQ